MIGNAQQKFPWNNSMAKSFYITTTIPYVNDKPHIGFALEIIQADALARYKRLMGHDVFFSTGTDEHGLKIYQKAQEEGRDPQEYVDHFAETFKELKGTLNISRDNFIRTTDPNHIRAAQEFWNRCSANGDIYKKNYSIKYCIGCELEKTDSELDNGRCPLHPHKEVELIEEENYFFRLSRYQKEILSYLEDESSIIPDFRREEARLFVNQGLQDFSISRLKSKMPWGVPVPGDSDHVMYVWFDALVNYISTLGWPSAGDELFRKFWEEGESVQCAGKDQVRMQSIMWQGMLLSAGVPHTTHIFYHGFINIGGQKMSKSLGNVIDPLELVAEYGVDALRYFVLRDVHPYEDSDVTLERIKESYNANLANGLGNLVARVMKLAETHLPEGTRPEPVPFYEEYTKAFERFEFNRAMDIIWNRIAALDAKITETEPFKVVKVDLKKGRALIFELTQELYYIGRLLNPFMPYTNEIIKKAVIENKKPETIFPRKD